MAPAGYDIDDFLDVDVCTCSLTFKPDGKERARERGAREIEGNFLTLKTTKRLITLVYDHLPHSVSTAMYPENLSPSLTAASSLVRLGLPCRYRHHFASLGRRSQRRCYAHPPPYGLSHPACSARQ